jgi:hypothetical protein
MKTPLARRPGLPSFHRRLATSPAVVLWRPEIVLATSITAVPARRAVALAEPASRPEALGTQRDTTRSVLATLADARHALGLPAAAHRRAEEAASTRERVSATIDAYRAEGALDDVLSGAWRRMSALMEERGLQ